MQKEKKDGSVISHTLRFFWRELCAHKVLAFVMIATAILNIFVMNSIAPLALSKIIDKLTSGDFNPDTIFVDFAPLITLFVGVIFLGELVFIRLMVWALWKLEILSVYELNRRSFDVLAQQSMHFHNNRFSGSLVSQVNKFSGAFERLVDLTCFDIIPLFFTVVFTLSILATILPIYALGLLVFITIYVVVAILAYKKIGPLSEALSSAETKQSGQLADSVSNIMAIKSYANESRENIRFSNFRRATANSATRLMRASTVRDFIFGLVSVALSALIVIFVVGGNKWFGLSIGTVVLLYTYTTSILNLLWSFNHILRNINRVFGDAHDMTKILNEEVTVKDQPSAQKLVIKQGTVDFQSISFVHADAKEAIFQDFSLSIKAGERIGLVGISGSGKTTLTKLLLRFADVNGGEILVDGQNIKNVTQSSLRENIAYVPQESTLFHRSLRENIAYGKQNATDEEIIEAAKKANAWEFVKDLPSGLDTLTGERGVKLSGGQRQRINIARAILKDAPILVLDEATSALDSESENLIQDALKKLMKNRTSLVIAHRLSTVASLDRIIVLKDGRIAEEGTHQQLLDKNGAYSKLWNRQTGAFFDE